MIEVPAFQFTPEQIVANFDRENTPVIETEDPIQQHLLPEIQLEDAQADKEIDDLIKEFSEEAHTVKQRR